ncbi:hypothetical protein AAG906_028913 [Vitis piasezkii]
MGFWVFWAATIVCNHLFLLVETSVHLWANLLWQLESFVDSSYLFGGKSPLALDLRFHWTNRTVGDTGLISNTLDLKQNFQPKYSSSFYCNKGI